MFLRTAFVAMTSLALAGTAEAGICLEADTERDNLAEADRQGGLTLLTGEIEDKGGQIGAPCDATWRVGHIKLGRSVTVTARKGDQVHKVTAEAMGDLPRVYSQLAHSMVTGESLSQATDRSNVTLAQAEGRRVKTEYMPTLMFGGTAYPPAGAVVAPTFGGGFRVEQDTWAIDGSMRFVLLGIEPDGEVPDENVAFGGHLNVLRFVAPLASSTPFYGAGIGYGMMGNAEGDSPVSSGFEARGFAGYEWGRNSSMRLFSQLDVTAPLYSTGYEYWSPTIGLSIGFAWKPPPRNNGVNWAAILF